MIWMIVCAVLAAAGLILIVWALLGWCVLPPRREAVTIYRLSASEPQLERQVRAFVWSRESGLAGGRLILAGGEEAPETAALAERLAAQYAAWNTGPCAWDVGSKKHGTGIANDTGDRSGGHLSESGNGYCVLKVRTEQSEAVTVVGVIPMCVVGERLAIVGRWTRHQSFGQQFEAEFLERLMPETTSEILAFLSSRAVKGIGPKMAEKIVSRFGEKSLNVLEQDPMQLTQIPGISEKKAQEMSESFQKQSGIRRLIEFLTIYHLPAQLAVRLYRAYGELAQEALRDDPYLLTDSYYRADFSQVDAFAIALGVSADDERRVEAGILFELSYNLGAGHTFIPQDKLRTATCALLDLDGEMIDAGMLRLQEQGRMELSQIAGLTACYLPELYEAETYVCRRILSMADGEYPEPGRIDDLVAEIENRQGIDYAPEQRSAIRAAASRQLLIVTGGPGTGKTTVMSGILRLFDALRLKTQLAAPTGRAAKRLSEVTAARPRPSTGFWRRSSTRRRAAWPFSTTRTRRLPATR